MDNAVYDDYLTLLGVKVYLLPSNYMGRLLGDDEAYDIRKW
jgi:hypothetical protein